jgi:hypothetical protein
MQVFAAIDAISGCQMLLPLRAGRCPPEIHDMGKPPGRDNGVFICHA